MELVEELLDREAVVDSSTKVLNAHKHVSREWLVSPNGERKQAGRYASHPPLWYDKYCWSLVTLATPVICHTRRERKKERETNCDINTPDLLSTALTSNM